MKLGIGFDDLSRPVAIREIEHVVEFPPFDCKKHFDDVKEQICGQFSIAEDLQSQGRTVECEMIWRSQYVMIVAAFDFYMHELTKYGINQMRKEIWKQSTEYKSIAVPLSIVENWNQIDQNEYENYFLDFISEKFSIVTLVDGEKVTAHLKLLGIQSESIASRIYEATSEKSVKKIFEDALHDIFFRRNRIAHQVDRSHGDATEYEITKEDVESCIAILSDVVGSIDLEIQEKNKRKYLNVVYLILPWTDTIMNTDTDQFCKDSKRKIRGESNSLIFPFSKELNAEGASIIERCINMHISGKRICVVLKDINNQRKKSIACNLKDIYTYDQQIVPEELKDRIPYRMQNITSKLFFEIDNVEKKDINMGNLVTGEYDDVSEIINELENRVILAYQKKYWE